MILIITLAGALLLYILQGIIYEKYWDKNLDVSVSFKNNNCVEGEHNTLVEVITNNKRLPLPVLHVKINTPRTFLFKNESNTSVTDFYYRDDMFSIMGHQVITRTLDFECSKRGCYYMKDTSLVSNDLFLQKTFNKSIQNSGILHVYPAKVDISRFSIPFNTITGNFATQKTLVEDPFEFRGIRQYQSYDSIHSINWKSSARTGTLQVNTFFMTSSQDVTILLNLDTHIYTKNNKLIESAIRIASSLAENFIRCNIPVCMETNGIDIFTNGRIFQPSGQGYAHMSAIDNALSRIDTDKENIDFMNVMENIFKSANENSYYIIISNNRHEDLTDYYLSLKSRGLSCYFIVPEYASFEVDENIPDMIKWELE